MEKRTSGFGSRLGGALKKGALVGGVALAGIGVAGLKMAMDLEKGLAEVRTLLPDLSDEGFNMLQADVLALSKEMGIATDKIVPALYQAISAGVPRENVIDFLRTGAKASIGGVTDLETAVDGLTTITNAWGLESSEAGRIADVMFTGVKLGKTTMAELSESMFQAAPLAAALGVSVEEVVGATATLTKSGVPTAQAMTQMRQAMVSLAKPTKEMSELIELTGFENGEALIQAKGFTGALDLLTEAADNDKEVMAKAFGSVEALGFVLATTGENAEGAAADLANVTDSAGASEAAFETMEETTSRKLAKAINILKVELTKLGVKVLPVVAKALSGLIEFLGKVFTAIDKFVKGFRGGFKHMGDSAEGFTGHGQRLGKIFRLQVLPVLKVLVEKVFPKFARTMKSILSVGLKVIKFLKENKDILLAVGIAIVAVLVPGIIAWTVATIANVAAHIALAAATLLAYAPIILLIAGIALLAFGIIQLIKHWDEIMAFIKQKVIPMFENLWATIDDFLSNLPVIGVAWEAVKQVMKDKIDAVIGIVTGIIDIGKNVISFFKNVFKGEWGAAWTDLKEIAMGVLNLFLDFLRVSFFGTIFSILASIIPWDWVKENFNAFVTNVKGKFNDVLAFITGLGTSWGAAAFGLGRAILDGMKNGIETGLFIVKSAINGIIKLVEDGINRLIRGVNKIAGVLSVIPLAPDIPTIPEIRIPRLHRGAFDLPRDMVAQLQKGETVLSRDQTEVVRDVVRAPQPIAGIPGLDRLLRALQSGRGDYITNVQTASQEQVALEVERVMRRMAFSLGKS